MGFADRVGARSFQAMVAMRDGTRLNSFVFFAGERRPALAGHLASYAIGDHRVECPRQDRLRHSIGAQPRGALPRFAPARLVATSLLAVMPAFTKTRAAVTGRKARIMSTPMTPPTATIRSNGSPPSLGPIRGGVCPARPRVPPPPFPPRQQDTQARAFFFSSRRTAPLINPTTGFTRSAGHRAACGQ